MHFEYVNTNRVYRLYKTVPAWEPNQCNCIQSASFRILQQQLF